MYRISFSKTASKDIEESIDYIQNVLKNPIAAESLILEAENKILGIREFPYSCSLVSDPYLRKLEIRFLVVKNYVAFFRIDESVKEILIVRFLYGKREWQTIFKDTAES